MIEHLIQLAILCGPLSLLSFGGGQTILAGLQQQVVGAHGWMTPDQFTEYFALSKVAPGPSTLIVALVGWHMAGIWGALVASLAIYLPSSLLVAGVGGWWGRHRRTRLTLAIERGLQPIAVGLLLSGTAAMVQIADLGPIDYATVAVTVIVLLRTKIGPYPIIGTVATLHFCIGLFGI